jgi:P-type Ca2+ transporter type 2C
MEKGITSEEARGRLTTHGYNEISTKSSTTWLTLLLAQLVNFLNGILFAAAIISLIIGDLLDGFFILVVIILNALFGFIQEYRAEKSLEKLKNYTVQTVRVFRDGKEVELPAREVVPGDVIVLSEGDRVPADGRASKPHRLEIDEAILTGESLPVLKEEHDEVFSGTLISKGKGYLLVEKIGMQTRFGQIAQTLSDMTNEQTPLQKNLASLGKILTVIILIIAGLLIPIGMLRNEPAFTMLLTAVSIAVAAIPQGLPAVITVALAIGTARMAKRHAIVRTMPSVETLGAVQYVLVDKTGTLTENNMRVKKHWLSHTDHLHGLLFACLLGNTASLVKEAASESFEIVGDKTDGALLLWARAQDPSIVETIASGTIVDEHIFDSRTKTITTIWKRDVKEIAYVRGAPEALLARSKLSDEERKKISEHFETFAKEGLRVIAFGSRPVTNARSMQRDELEKNLTFLGFIGIYDPPRKEVKEAIHHAQVAGIRTIMVTGDNELTALAIGKEIGLVEKDEDVITGEELDKLTDEELQSLLLKTRIFARARPHDKLRLTTLLKKAGFVVGVTGDGVNDALALKKADVGVAMGISGTDVAKEASDIIIADDNFSTFVRAIEEGRTIYRNIVTAIMYLLTGNLSELALVFFGTLLGMPPPLLPTQILWINLVTDVLPAISLASDTKHPDILKDKPRDPRQPILTRKRIVFILIGGFGLAFLLLGIYGVLLESVSVDKARTIVFNLLVFSHMMLAFVVRRQSIFRLNKMLILSVILILSLQMAITIIPVFQEIFQLAY